MPATGRTPLTDRHGSSLLPGRPSHSTVISKSKISGHLGITPEPSRLPSGFVPAVAARAMDERRAAVPGRWPEAAEPSSASRPSHGGHKMPRAGREDAASVTFYDTFTSAVLRFG